MCRRIMTAAFLALGLMRGSAAAQDQGQIGIAAGYPGIIGVVWQIADRVAVRPEISFSHSWTETSFISTTFENVFTIPGTPQPVTFPTITTTSSYDAWSTSTGVSVLLYMNKWDHVRTYIAPGYGYRRTSATSISVLEISGSLPGLRLPGINEPRASKTTSASHAGSAMFGVQYTPHRHFAVFGDFGFRYTSSNPPASQISGVNVREGDAGSFGTSASVGVVLYLR